MDKPILGIFYCLLYVFPAHGPFLKSKTQIDLGQLAKDNKLQAINRQVIVVTDGEYPAVKLNEGEDDGLVWIPDIIFMATGPSRLIFLEEIFFKRVSKAWV